MEAMLKQAAARKQENDRYEQRKIQREREQEEDEFGDKEKFVTSAYKQRQAEIQALEEEERAKEGKRKEFLQF